VVALLTKGLGKSRKGERNFRNQKSSPKANIFTADGEADILQEGVDERHVTLPRRENFSWTVGAKGIDET